MKTYEVMLREAEAILRDLNQPTLDLDSVVGKVEEGLKIIAEMKKRLEETSLKIEKLKQSEMQAQI